MDFPLWDYVALVSDIADFFFFFFLHLCNDPVLNICLLDVSNSQQYATNKHILTHATLHK